MRLYLRTSTRKHRFDRPALLAAVRALLLCVGEPRASLALSLVGDAAIRRLNREHRGKDKATDVLSFPLASPHDVASDGAPERLLGDIVISLDTAKRQARAYGATLDAELLRLLIHGLLHVLGHDHERPGEARRMRAEERRLAAAAGLPWPY